MPVRNTDRQTRQARWPRAQPPTPAAVLEEVVSELDLVLVMTACGLEVDGGIHPATAPLVVEAGARVLVAGAAIFEDPAGVRAEMQRLRRCACKSA